MTLLTMIMKMSEGLGKTCAIFFLTILFSLPLGMLITLLRMSKNKVVSSVTRFVIAVLRGTPLMLQLLAVTYGPYYLFGTAVAKNKLIPVHQLRGLFCRDLPRRHRVHPRGAV